MTAKKQSEVVTRRVWRMTPHAPAGKYLDLELVPKEIPHQPPVTTPKRTLHPESPPAYRTVALGPEVPPEAPPQTESAGKYASRTAPPQEQPSEDVPSKLRIVQANVGAKAKVIRPAEVESWQSSSFDLLTGCKVRDVTDTIPGNVFDEWFRPGGEDVFFSRGPSRRR